jgi:hypothetical protein
MTRSTWALVAAVVLMAGGLFAAAAEEAKNLLKDSNKPESWKLEVNENGKGTMTADDGAILFDVTAAGTENWHVQAYITGLTLEEGKEYTITYKAKGEPTRSIIAMANIDESDWHGIGLQEEVYLSKEWKEQTHTFKAENVAKSNKNRIGFILGADKGKVWIKDASLTEKQPKLDTK